MRLDGDLDRMSWRGDCKGLVGGDHRRGFAPVLSAGRALE